jgi:glucokinase
MQYLFGVDIGGTTVKIGLVSYETNKLLDKFEIVTSTKNNGDAILPDVVAAIKNYCNEKQIDYKDIKGIGLGVPGAVSNGVVNKCINLGWGVKNVVKDFKELLGFETIVECDNDANCAALGEMLCGDDSTYHSAIMLTLGTGVGGGIILNGKPISGFTGAAGELGHMHVDAKYNFKCNCGLTGCLETVASATGVVRVAKEFLKTEKSVLVNDENLTCKDVFDAAKSGDELALKVVDELGYHIGLATSLLAVTTNPEVFIIGGGVSRAGQILIESIEKHFQKFAYHAVKNTKFILASLGNDSGMLGAALLTKE